MCQLPTNSLQVVCEPGEDIFAFVEEIYETLSLFLGEVRADMHTFFWVNLDNGVFFGSSAAYALGLIMDSLLSTFALGFFTTSLMRL